MIQYYRSVQTTCTEYIVPLYCCTLLKVIFDQRSAPHIFELGCHLSSRHRLIDHLTIDNSTPSQWMSFSVGDVVTWKGADDEIPSGSLGKVLKVFGDGDVEVSFNERPGVEACVYTFGEDRLDLALPRGVTTTSVVFTLSDSFGVDLGVQTLVVKAVAPGSQAEEQGISVGWRILRVDGTAVSEVEGFATAISSAKVTGKTSCTIILAHKSGNSNTSAVRLQLTQ